MYNIKSIWNLYVISSDQIMNYFVNQELTQWSQLRLLNPRPMIKRMWCSIISVNLCSYVIEMFIPNFV